MRKLIIAGAVVAALALVAVGIGGAATSAQEGDGPIGTFLSKLAEKLGVGEDELKDAIQDTQLEMIDEAVAEGRLTEEQADRLRERVEGDGFLFPRPRHGGQHKARMGALIMDAAADILGVEKDELKEARQDGQSLVQIAEGQGISPVEFTAALLEEARTQLDALVEEGVLTQERADKIFEAIEDNIDRIVNAEPRERGRFPGPRGHPGFDGPRHGPFDGEPKMAEPSEVTA